MKDLIEALMKQADFHEGEYWRREHYAANQEIIHQGEQSKHLYYIEKGQARVLGQVDLGEKRKVSPGVCDLKDNEIFGELVLFDNGPRSASVVAISECDVVVFDGEKLMSYLRSHTDIGFELLNAIMTATVRRLRKTNEKIFSLFAWGLKAHNVDQHL